MSATLPLDPETWDLILDKSGDWTARKDEAFVASQSVANACLLSTDDSYFFPEEGIPYKWDILGERSAQPLLEAYIKREALAVPNVVKCKIVNYQFKERTIHGNVIIWTKNGGKYDVSF
jgi:hypothetical protein